MSRSPAVPWRVVLRAALLVVLLVTLLSAPELSPAARAGDEPAARADHVVLVILGGGVRAKEMLDPALMPTVAAIGAKGVVVEGVASEARSPYAGATTVLVGRGDVPDVAGRPRPGVPTLLECVRRGRSLAPEQVWFVSAPGGDDLNLSASEHPDYGAAAAPSVAHGAGAFAEPLEGLLAAWGRPLPTEDASWALLRGLRAGNRAAVDTWLPEEVDAGLAESERVERALLAEIDRKALLSEGPAPQDERAIRAAITLLDVHRPVLLVVRLSGGVLAQSGPEPYVAALRSTDAGLARVRAVVERAVGLRGRTVLVVVGDMGRNAGPDAEGRLASSDDSPERREVALVAEGPGLRKGGRAPKGRTLADVAPTLARLLGVPMPFAQGTAWEGVLEPSLGGR